jgi:hypothetical protein
MAEHCVRPSRRRLLQILALAGGALIAPRRVLHRVAAAPSARCVTAPATLLNQLAMVEALSVTFYHRAITTEDGFFVTLPTAYQRYLQVTLDAEAAHYRLLVADQGATPTQNEFYLPATQFESGAFGAFLATAEALETLSIGLYLAALRQVAADDAAQTATLLGQLAAVEAEHRVIVREMAQESPPAPNNRCFERADWVCAEQAIAALAPYLTGEGGFVGPYDLPSDTAIAAAVGDATCTPIPAATAATCQETLNGILTTLAAAEALGITCYYGAITGEIFAQLPAPQQWYLQAALDEERHHLDFLLRIGAEPPPDHFFFAPGVFADLPAFLALLDGLENAFISAYLAAIRQFRHLGEPLLAEIAGQIVGVEAEHRVLGRVLQGARLPHDHCLARAEYGCVAEAATALTPFLAGDAAHTEQQPLPDTAQIDAAVDRFGCTAVPLATVPPDLFLPLIAR